MELNEKEQKILLSLARASIASGFSNAPLEYQKPDSDSLNRASGAFVTLRRQGDLRGCIGYVEARFPLAETICQVARKAAFEDPRFQPVSQSELEEIDIEISVMSALQKVRSVEEIEVGKHGLVVEAEAARGLLLPHVATEYSWSREELLQHTCLKAGIPFDSWMRQDVLLYTFVTQTFSERKLGLLPHEKHP